MERLNNLHKITQLASDSLTPDSLALVAVMFHSHAVLRLWERPGCYL